jgi:diguanylate cyclase (GGDEF)-like protein
LTFVTLASLQIAFIAKGADAGATVALGTGVLIVGAALIVRAAVMRRRQAVLLERLRESERELRHVNERLSRESRQDPLTSLANRLRLREDFRDLAAHAARHGQGYCVVLFDLDQFKAYNDDFGHQAGDVILREVAALLRGQARDGDHLYRYGGEELLLVLPEPDVASGGDIAERHRMVVQRAALPHPRNAPDGVVTLSGGVAAARPGETPDDVLRRADHALYLAKSLGRNRIVQADGPAPADVHERSLGRSA